MNSRPALSWSMGRPLRPSGHIFTLEFLDLFIEAFTERAPFIRYAAMNSGLFGSCIGEMLGCVTLANRSRCLPDRRRCHWCLRRDECGDWAIFGNNGHIYAVPEGFQLTIGCDFEPRWSSARGWTEAKRRLAFGKETQDGNEEGAIILERLPTQEEATDRKRPHR
jgi:hypothetical protein